MSISTKSNDTQLEELLKEVHKGINQLPEFQRNWTWDDNRIRGIIASISQGYPMGAILRLKYGNPEIQFKCRLLEGVDENNVKREPEHLILDGQQRLTSIYQAAYSQNPVKIKPVRKAKGKEKEKFIERRYYLLMEKCLQDKEDRLEAVLSVPADKIVKENFDRDIVMDLSSDEKEYAEKAFPLNIIFDSSKLTSWILGYGLHYIGNSEALDLLKRFKAEVLDTIIAYKLPVITIPQEAPREAVCRMFENVNTGGVALTVFELVTAMFATHEEFNLREDWEECRKIIRGKNENLNTDLMDDIDATTFLTAVTLYTSYMRKRNGKSGTVSCKKKDVLDLDYDDYKNNRWKVVEGFRLARDFLLNYTCVFRKRDLPYTTQLIPLAAIFAVLGNKYANDPNVQPILSKWYWCGILGEMYGGANETRYANDIEDIIDIIEGRQSQMRTVNAAFFSSTRLLTLQSRLSAAYKGIMALLYKEECKDFVSSITINKVNSMTMSPDIHHIFPEAYCEKTGIDRKRYNCVVNKTPLLPETNRSIGGRAPKDYIAAIKNKVKGLTEEELRGRVESHFIDYNFLVNNDFDAYFIDRAKKLLKLIEDATGKTVTDKNSEETVREFGKSLS